MPMPRMMAWSAAAMTTLTVNSSDGVLRPDQYSCRKGEALWLDPGAGQLTQRPHGATAFPQEAVKAFPVTAGMICAMPDGWRRASAS